MKLQTHKILFLFLVFSFASICQAQDFSDAKKTVDTFLHNWLIEQNMALVENDFARNLFDNKFLLDDVDFEDIEAKDRKNIQKLKQIASDFFLTTADRVYGNSLAEIIVLDNVIYSFEEDELLSSLEKDKYVLTKMDKSRKSKNFVYIKSKFPSDGYLKLSLLVKLKEDNGEKIELPLYFIWAKENASWKIIQFGAENQ